MVFLIIVIYLMLILTLQNYFILIQVDGHLPQVAGYMKLSIIIIIEACMINK